MQEERRKAEEEAKKEAAFYALCAYLDYDPDELEDDMDELSED